MYVNAADLMQIQYEFRSRMETFHSLRDGGSGLGPHELDHDILRNCRCSGTVFRKLAIRRNMKTYTNHGQSWQWWCDRMLMGWHKRKLQCKPCDTKTAFVQNSRMSKVASRITPKLQQIRINSFEGKFAQHKEGNQLAATHEKARKTIAEKYCKL
jgi:hypothetical protein